MRTILHIDMNSYFASVEQQANPRLRGRPIGVTGGDREERTVLATASIEAKKLGVKTGMALWEAKKICPNLIIVRGNHEKYLSITARFLDIFKDYTPNLEVFSIDEAFLLIEPSGTESGVKTAQQIKHRLKSEIGERVTCSIGISYNKLLAKLAGSLHKPDGLVVIPDQQTALEILDKAELDDLCGLGPRTKKKLFNMGIRNFKTLRRVPKELLVASFKSYGEVLYNMAWGVDHSPVKPFWSREEVQSIGHRHTLDKDTEDIGEIKSVLLKISEMVARRLRDKSLVGKTVHCWYRASFHPEGVFHGDGKQVTLNGYTADGLELFKKAWKVFGDIWNGQKVRMIGAAVSNLKPGKPVNLPLLPEDNKNQAITQALDKVNRKFGDFTLARGSTLGLDSLIQKTQPLFIGQKV